METRYVCGFAATVRTGFPFPSPTITAEDPPCMSCMSSGVGDSRCPQRSVLSSESSLHAHLEHHKVRSSFLNEDYIQCPQHVYDHSTHLLLHSQNTGFSHSYFHADPQMCVEHPHDCLHQHTCTINNPFRSPVIGNCSGEAAQVDGATSRTRNVREGKCNMKASCAKGSPLVVNMDPASGCCSDNNPSKICNCYRLKAQEGFVCTMHCSHNCVETYQMDLLDVGPYSQCSCAAEGSKKQCSNAYQSPCCQMDMSESSQLKGGIACPSKHSLAQPGFDLETCRSPEDAVIYNKDDTCNSWNFTTYSVQAHTRELHSVLWSEDCSRHAFDSKAPQFTQIQGHPYGPRDLGDTKKGFNGSTESLTHVFSQLGKGQRNNSTDEREWGGKFKMEVKSKQCDFGRPKKRRRRYFIASESRRNIWDSTSGKSSWEKESQIPSESRNCGAHGWGNEIAGSDKDTSWGQPRSPNQMSEKKATRLDARVMEENKQLQRKEEFFTVTCEDNSIALTEADMDSHILLDAVKQPKQLYEGSSSTNPIVNAKDLSFKKFADERTLDEKHEILKPASNRFSSLPEDKNAPPSDPKVMESANLDCFSSSSDDRDFADDHLQYDSDDYFYPVITSATETDSLNNRENEAYEFFMQILEENEDLKKKYKQEYAVGEFDCLVCSNIPNKPLKTYKGLVSVVMHAKTILNTKRRHDHRGFARAVCNFMGWDAHGNPTDRSSIKTQPTACLGDVENVSEEKSLRDGRSSLAALKGNRIEKVQIEGLQAHNGQFMAKEVQMYQGPTESLGNVSSEGNQILKMKGIASRDSDTHAATREDMDGTCSAVCKLVGWDLDDNPAVKTLNNSELRACVQLESESIPEGNFMRNGFLTNRLLKDQHEEKSEVGELNPDNAHSTGKTQCGDQGSLEPLKDVDTKCKELCKESALKGNNIFAVAIEENPGPRSNVCDLKVQNNHGSLTGKTLSGQRPITSLFDYHDIEQEYRGSAAEHSKESDEEDMQTSEDISENCKELCITQSELKDKASFPVVYEESGTSFRHLGSITIVKVTFNLSNPEAIHINWQNESSIQARGFSIHMKSDIPHTMWRFKGLGAYGNPALRETNKKVRHSACLYEFKNLIEGKCPQGGAGVIKRSETLDLEPKQNLRQEVEDVTNNSKETLTKRSDLEVGDNIPLSCRENSETSILQTVIDMEKGISQYSSYKTTTARGADEGSSYAHYHNTQDNFRFSPFECSKPNGWDVHGNPLGKTDKSIQLSWSMLEPEIPSQGGIFSTNHSENPVTSEPEEGSMQREHLFIQSNRILEMGDWVDLSSLGQSENVCKEGTDIFMSGNVLKCNMVFPLNCGKMSGTGMYERYTDVAKQISNEFGCSGSYTNVKDEKLVAYTQASITYENCRYTHAGHSFRWSDVHGDPMVKISDIIHPQFYVLEPEHLSEAKDHKSKGSINHSDCSLFEIQEVRIQREDIKWQHECIIDSKQFAHQSMRKKVEDVSIEELSFLASKNGCSFVCAHKGNTVVCIPPKDDTVMVDAMVRSHSKEVHTCEEGEGSVN
ncbi:hypothetical protein KP509_03G018700 [Ceratopteris richardii]|uniref:Uncharacterized protein n=1 Tax=Ceratopteris richardii TaxID=49495 RepID=A0A8T2V0N1_CERRI|nr:hypothetical protein KP509_03G018700 [Ceratopteris richardii]